MGGLWCTAYPAQQRGAWAFICLHPLARRAWTGIVFQHTIKQHIHVISQFLWSRIWAQPSSVLCVRYYGAAIKVWSRSFGSLRGHPRRISSWRVTLQAAMVVVELICGHYRNHNNLLLQGQQEPM